MKKFSFVKDGNHFLQTWIGSADKGYKTDGKDKNKF